MTLNMNSAQVVETSVTVSNNSYFSELHHTRTITLTIQTFKGKLFSFLSRVLSRGFLYSILVNMTEKSSRSVYMKQAFPVKGHNM